MNYLHCKHIQNSLLKSQNWIIASFLFAHCFIIVEAYYQIISELASLPESLNMSNVQHVIGTINVDYPITIFRLSVA